MNNFGIDCDTSGKKMLISKLSKLKSVKEVTDGGIYYQDDSYSQIHVKTSMSKDELDEWCYRVKFPRCFNIIGVFEISEKDFKC